MIINAMTNASIIFLGIIDFLGCIGGLLAVSFMLWLFGTRRGAAVRACLRLDDEYRCRECAACDYCYAAFTGVAYPCPHFEEKEDKP